MSTVETKDWNRMYDLIADGKDGDSVARSIRFKDKAVARYAAGLKLLNQSPEESFSSGRFTGYFSAFGNKALDLGATINEIQTTWENASPPKHLIDQLKAYINDSEIRVNIPDNFFKEIRHADIEMRIDEDDRLASDTAKHYAQNKESKVVVPIKMVFNPYDALPQEIDLDVIMDENGQSNKYVFVSQENFDTKLDLYDEPFGYTELHDGICSALNIH